MLSWALVLGLAALFAGLGVQAGQRADELDALALEQSATAEIEPAGSFEHSLRSASTTTSPIEPLNQPPRLTLKLFSRGTCVEFGAVELVWRISGGVPPYTRTLDGATIDETDPGSALVTCGLSTADPAPGLKRTFKGRVTDSRGVTAQDELRLALTAPPPRAARGAVAHDASTEAALRLSWTAVSAIPSVSAYELRYQATAWDAAGWPDAWTAIGDAIAGSATEYVHRNLDSNRRYRYQLRARNGVDAGEWSRTFPAVGLRPGAPLLEARTAASGSVALSWSAGPAAATRWEYRRKPADGSWGAWTTIADAGALTAEHTVSGLTEDARYHFQLRATTTSGTGRASATAVAVAGLTPSTPRIALLYDAYDATGGATAPGAFAFLSDAGDLSSGVVNYADAPTAVALLVNAIGYRDRAYADFLNSVAVGDSFTWERTQSCWTAYRITALLNDPPAPARKLFAIELTTQDSCTAPVRVSGRHDRLIWGAPPSEPRIGADGIRIFPYDYPVEGGHTYRLSEWGSPRPVVIDVPAGMRLIDRGSSDDWIVWFEDEASGAWLGLRSWTGREESRGDVPAEQGSGSETRDVGALFDAIVASARVQPDPEASRERIRDATARPVPTRD